ncbi:MAG: hypothetical protein EZS28_042599 [Streblomastix strix]|uniref:Protein kinase domain-containing protein n=1 Tax=Streblomastix strix TaxID=222440 RepID=A0A5J4TUD3_9EUKA|nr:MAG: hypothetical protein EZS28_042599 [Streblomastix strix]
MLRTKDSTYVLLDFGASHHREDQSKYRTSQPISVPPTPTSSSQQQSSSQSSFQTTTTTTSQQSADEQIEQEKQRQQKMQSLYEDMTDDEIAEGGTVIGTPGYIAPEVLEGLRTFKSDIFSLAATIVFLIAKEQPSKIKGGVMNWKSLDSVKALNLDQEFVQTIDMMLDPDPASRDLPFFIDGKRVPFVKKKKELSPEQIAQFREVEYAEKELEIDESMKYDISLIIYD